MTKQSAVDLAPSPERTWWRKSFVGLDLGRSTVMNRFVATNGPQSAVYAVCVQFWIIVMFALGVIAVTAEIISDHHRIMQIVGAISLVAFAVTIFMTFLRLYATRRFSKSYRK